MRTKNIETVRQMFEAFGRGDIEGLLARFDDDVSWSYPEGTILGGRHQGRAGILRFISLIGRIYPAGLQVAEVTLFADRDRVFAEFPWVATSVRGDRVRERALIVFELRGGRVVAIREYNQGGERSAISDLTLDAAQADAQAPGP